MAALESELPRPLRLSIVVPFHNRVDQLRQCLAAVQAAASVLPSLVEVTDLVVAADGAREDPAAVAAEFGARIVVVPGPQGPAVARNRGAASVGGDVLVFVDTDVVVHEQALARIAAPFVADPELGAVFGAYDESPADPGFFSQSRNLAHAFIHQRSSRDASTFWAGLGAVRADVFREAGGFDERLRRPSVEDIELGYRVRRAGHRIVLDPTIQGKHLKRWTFWSGLVTDVRDRGVPWTQLLARYGAMRNDLNLTLRYRVCVVLAYLLVGCLVGSFVWPPLLWPAGALLASLWFLDAGYYRFFVKKRGLAHAAAWFPFHVLHHLTNGVSFVIGTLLFRLQKGMGVVLPWTLSPTAWAASGAGGAVADSTRAED